MDADVLKPTRIWFPGKPSWSDTLGRLFIGLTFVGSGTWLAAVSLMANRVAWVDAARLGQWVWLAVPLGLAFAAAGVALLLNRSAALVDRRHGRVTGWLRPDDTFPISRRLSDFDTVEARLYPEDDPAPPAYGYVLRLRGPAGAIVLQTFTGAEAAQRRARKLAAALDFHIADPPPPPGRDFGLKNLALFSGAYEQDAEEAWLDALARDIQDALQDAGLVVTDGTRTEEFRGLKVTVDRWTFAVELGRTPDESRDNEWYCLTTARRNPLRSLRNADDTAEHRRLLKILRPTLEHNPDVRNLGWFQDWEKLEIEGE
jgi:hypothetical protein